jgi:hypothetical protein
MALLISFKKTSSTHPLSEKIFPSSVQAPPLSPFPTPAQAHSHGRKAARSARPCNNLAILCGGPWRKTPPLGRVGRGPPAGAALAAPTAAAAVAAAAAAMSVGVALVGVLATARSRTPPHWPLGRPRKGRACYRGDGKGTRMAQSAERPARTSCCCSPELRCSFGRAAAAAALHAASRHTASCAASVQHGARRTDYSRRWCPTEGCLLASSDPVDKRAPCYPRSRRIFPPPKRYFHHVRPAGGASWRLSL